MFEIEKGVEMPPPRERCRLERTFPFSDMQVGDSFLVPCENDEKMLRKLQQQAMRTAQKYVKKNGWKFTSRISIKGVRVWRTE